MKAGPRRQGDRGAASLEYAGALLVVVLVIASLITFATPIGAQIQAKICQALGANCGTAAAEARARALGIKCVVGRSSDKMNINASAEVRVERTDQGSSTAYGDGTGQVVLVQGAGVGDDESSALGDYAAAKFKITGNADVGLVYRFPTGYGGSRAADSFLADRRDATHTVAEILLPPGTQALDEGGHRIANWVGDHFSDDILGPFGLGPSKAEKEARTRQQAAQTADAVQVSLSIQGSAGVDAGAGVSRRTNNADGSTSDSELQAPLAGNVTLNGSVTGTMTVPLHLDGPDKVAALFTGELSGDVTGSGSIGGLGPIPPFLNGSFNAGAKGSYTVAFDEHGNPSTLILTTETALGASGGLNPRSYDSGKGKAGAQAAVKGSGITTTTQVLDLNSKTPQGQANLAAFNDFFDVNGVSANGYTGKVVTPKALRNGTGPVAAAELVSQWSELSQRLSADAFTTTATYAESTNEYGGDIKVAGVGVGGSYSDTIRRLQTAAAHDNRYGLDIQLASCPGS